MLLSALFESCLAPDTFLGSQADVGTPRVRILCSIWISGPMIRTTHFHVHERRATLSASCSPAVDTAPYATSTTVSFGLSDTYRGREFCGLLCVQSPSVGCISSRKKVPSPCRCCAHFWWMRRAYRSEPASGSPKRQAERQKRNKEALGEGSRHEFRRDRADETFVEKSN